MNADKIPVSIAIIGGGNMGQSIISGLIAGGFSSQRIHVYEPDTEKCRQLSSNFAIRMAVSEQQAVTKANVVVFAVKPQHMQKVMLPLAPLLLAQKSLVISVAAGVRLATLESWLGTELAIVRAMPNIAAMVGMSITGMIANAAVSEEYRQLAEWIIQSFGSSQWFSSDEDMDIVTAVTGSGPAYVFLVMEAIQEAACELGMESVQVQALVAATFAGAAKMVLAGEGEPARLRQRVTSPGGTTECAVQILQQAELSQLFKKALVAARDRARELAVQD